MALHIHDTLRREKRLFAPGPLPAPIDFRGVRLGVPICEDIWFPFVTAHLRAEGAEILISPNGSPYEIDKDDRRINAVAGTRVRETGLPLVYVNRIGGQDELVFDGCSFVLNDDGRAAHRLIDWEAEERVTRWAGAAATCAARRLGDDAREPEYIKTVRSEGYVFSLPVRLVEAHP